MKQLLKLAELNWIATLARREEIAAKESGDEDRIMSAESKVEMTAEAEEKHLKSNKASKECHGKNIEVLSSALQAAGYDNAVLDYLEFKNVDGERIAVNNY